MRTWLNIANIIALLCLAIIMIVTCKNIEIYEEQFNETRLITATEYAAEAAFIDSIIVSDNNTTYNSVNVTMLTKDTLRTFCDMMALSFNMSRGESNYVAIEESIGVMCIASNDGYYITDVTEVNNGEYRLVWSPKIPYSVKLKRASDQTEDILGVTLSDEQWRIIPEKGKAETGWSYDELGIIWENPETPNNPTNPDDPKNILPQITLTREYADIIVSSEITSAMAYRLEDRRFVFKPVEDEYSVFVPTLKTYSGINKIDSPSLLVIINNAQYSKYKGMCSILQGFKVIWKPKVIGFTTGTGEKKYCYEGQTAYCQDTISNVYTYSSIEDAARAGYMPDIYALMQPIDAGYTKH